MLAIRGGRPILLDFLSSLLRTSPFIRVLWVPSPSEQSRRIAFLSSSVGSWNHHSAINHVFFSTSAVSWLESTFIVFSGQMVSLLEGVPACSLGPHRAGHPELA